MFTEELYQERKDADATPKIGSIQTFGKHTFVWTSEHLLASETAPLRKEFDNLCAESLDTLLQIGKERTSLTGCPKGPVDDYSLLEQTHTIDPTLDKLWTQINTVPSWVDWAQIERGQKFFYRYALANIVGFAFQGFIGESTVAESAVEVLVRTGGFSIRMMLYRVLETFQFLLQATRSLEAIQPGGDGHISTVRVRFLHARVRKRILGLVERNGEYFDVVKHGPPINDLDAVLTNTFFCCNPMWIQLPLLGIQPKPDEIEDYIALFRYLAYLLGTPDDYFSSAKRAKMTMESLLVNELRPTENSKVVAANFISCLVDRPPFNVSRGFMEAGSREMNGDTLCDALRLGRPSFIWYIAFRGLVWLMQLLAFIQRIHPSMDRILIEVTPISSPLVGLFYTNKNDPVLQNQTVQRHC